MIVDCHILLISFLVYGKFTVICSKLDATCFTLCTWYYFTFGSYTPCVRACVCVCMSAWIWVTWILWDGSLSFSGCFLLHAIIVIGVSFWYQSHHWLNPSTLFTKLNTVANAMLYYWFMKCVARQYVQLVYIPLIMVP